MSEEQEMINATLDNGKRVKTDSYSVLYIKLLGKVTNMLISDQHQIKVCFMLVPVLRKVNLASVESSG